MYICVYTHICQNVYTQTYIMQQCMCDYICTLCQNGAGVVHLESVSNQHNNPKRVSKWLNCEEWWLQKITHIFLLLSDHKSFTPESVECAFYLINGLILRQEMAGNSSVTTYLSPCDIFSSTYSGFSHKCWYLGTHKSLNVIYIILNNSADRQFVQHE